MPRLLNRVQAAFYIGVSATKFDELVRDGRMPRPIRLDARVLWDRQKLDEQLNELADCEQPDDVWKRMSV